MIQFLVHFKESSMRAIFVFCLLLTTACFRPPHHVHVDIHPPLTPPDIKASSFKDLTPEEQKTDWGKELSCAEKHIHELDLFAASLALKRAAILSENCSKERQHEIIYGQIYNYFLSNKYDSVCEVFEKNPFSIRPNSFKAYNDLLVILWTSYLKKGQLNRSDMALKVLERRNPEVASKLVLYKNFMEKDIGKLPKEVQCKYGHASKSPFQAGLLNAILPGAGYLYAGQPQAALTSFSLNALFILATCEFFINDMPVAGVITLGFEGGWYFGGIHGAYHAAKKHNSINYNNIAKDYMLSHKIFPIYTFEYGF
jgi:hypothetical protein